MAVTIKDIAREAGVSLSTASNVLNNKSGVIKAGAETRERINAIAKRLNYSPSIMAKGLREGKTYLAGVMLDKINSSFAAEILQGIEDVFHKNGYSMILCSHETPDDFKGRLDQLERKKIDGLIIIKPQGERNKRACAEILRKKIPVVSACAKSEIDGIPSVYVDEEKIGLLAAEYMFNRGHREIAVISGGRPKCAETFKKYFESRGAPLSEKMLLGSLSTFDDGKEFMRMIKKGLLKVSAALAHSDIMAAGMISEARKLGVKIPGDISILGVDNMPLSAMTSPSITTIAQPQYEQGQKTAELLLEKIHSGGSLGDIVIAPYLVERESFAKLI
jgi:LacI family transcriptional regulator